MKRKQKRYLKPYTLREKVQIYIKWQRPLSGKVLLVIILGLTVLLVVLQSVSRSINTWRVGNAAVNASSAYSDDRFQATFVGDIMLGRNIARAGESGDYDDLFESASYLWNDSDYVFGNLECTIIDDVSSYKEAEKEIHLAADTEALAAVGKAGFTLLGIANNHIGDYGRKGMMTTLANLEKVNIQYTGLNETLAEGLLYKREQYDGLTISTCAISNIVVPDSESASAEDILSINNCDYQVLVANAAAVSDLTIVAIHWGVEYSKDISQSQQELAYELIDAGADIIIGAHPHVLQPLEIYNDGIIFYSLGNFVFDQGWMRTKDSVLVNLIIEDGRKYLNIYPMRINNGIPAYALVSLSAGRTLRQMTKLLDIDQYHIEDNILVVEWGTYEKR